MPLAKRRTILEDFGIREGHLLDKYLAVLLFKGRIGRGNCASVMEITRDKVSSWKGKLMPFQGRVVLINHVIVELQLHLKAIYKWPSSVTINAKKIMRNFLWTGIPIKERALL